MKNKYFILAALNEESLENWIWTNNESIPKGFIKITNKESNKTIVVFKRTIDDNYELYYDSKNTNKIKNKNELLIIMNEFYRDEILIQKNNYANLNISKANWFDILFNSNWKHPNPSISLIFKITIISFILGIISIIIGLIPTFNAIFICIKTIIK